MGRGLRISNSVEQTNIEHILTLKYKNYKLSPTRPMPGVQENSISPLRDQDGILERGQESLTFVKQF